MLAAVVLGAAVVGLVLALMIVLPTPNLHLIWSNLVLDFLAVFVEGFSLLLVAFALLGICVALVARRVGLRRSSLVAVVLWMVTVVLCLVPVLQGWRTAAQEGVALSLSEYFSLPSGGPSETVTYARPEGQELMLDVWRPPDDGGAAVPGRRPAVVAVHGGGGYFLGRSTEAPWAEWLADKGYVVFNIDYRLGDYRLGEPPPLRDATGDVKCAVGWIRENAGRYGVDSDPIALIGRSSGGHLALLTAYTEGDPQLPPSCDVSDTGVKAVAAFYSTDFTRNDEWPWWRPGLTSSLKDGPRRYIPEGDHRLLSPVSHVDLGDPPTFLTQGGEDQWVSPEQAVLLANRLEEAGVPHRLLELPWAKHAFDSTWGSWGSQIVRHKLGEFLEQRLED